MKKHGLLHLISDGVVQDISILPLVKYPSGVEGPELLLTAKSAAAPAAALGGGRRVPFSPALTSTRGHPG